MRSSIRTAAKSISMTSDPGHRASGSIPRRCTLTQSRPSSRKNLDGATGVLPLNRINGSRIARICWRLSAAICSSCTPTENSIRSPKRTSTRKTRDSLRTAATFCIAGNRICMFSIFRASGYVKLLRMERPLFSTVNSIGCTRKSWRLAAPPGGRRIRSGLRTFSSTLPMSLSIRRPT